jgi:subtilisin family serine protease
MLHVNVLLGRAAPPFLLGKGFVSFLCLALLAPVARARAQEAGPPAVVIRIQPGGNIQKLAASYETVPGPHIVGTGIFRMPVPADSDTADFLARLHTDPRVASAEADSIVQEEEVGGTQLHFAFDAGNKPGAYIDQNAYRQVHLGSAHSFSTGAGVRVAILDTGVLARHPALIGHLMPGYNALSPRDAPDDVPDGATNAAVGHGTMIAGLVARIAPGAKIVPIRVLNADGIGTIFSVVAGLHYAVTHGVRVVNMSFGATQPSDALENAVQEANRAGVVVVAAAGNNDNSAPYYPAALGNVLTVAGVEWNDVKSVYSNYGDYVGVVAPGSGIRSAYWTGGYANWSGTSFAAPFVTATATLVCALNPQYQPSQVIEQVLRSAHPVDRANPLYREQLGAGLLDVEGAVKNVSGDF